MIQQLEHIVVSVVLGVLAAGVVAAMLMAILPAPWRGRGVLAAVLAAAVAAAVRMRGFQPRKR